MKFVIDRSKWLCGELQRRRADVALPPLPSLLRDGDGNMCCLGFYALACGTHPIHINGYARLSTVGLSSLIYKHQTGAPVHQEELLMEANDDRRLPTKDRESKIRDLFEEIGVDCEFVGEYLSMTEAGST